MSAGSKGQICVSYATPETELVAVDFGLRADGLPSLSLGRVLFPRQPPLLVHEDHEAMTRVVATGQSPSTRYLQGTQRVSVAYRKCVR